ncbi:MAG TPA: hypothetical protein VHD90_05375 [Phototrophicaceae bacterium]|nr:hypothetical protein [Phototrophicaceae bacterium]
MAISEVIRDALAADGTLAALLTGGVYSYAQIGRNGISRVTTPSAYAAGGFLKPLAVVKASEVKAIPAIRDSDSGSQQVVEIFLYDDGDNGYTTVTSARDRVIALLDRQWMSGVGYLRQVGGADNLRDPKLNNAALVRVDFEVKS